MATNYVQRGERLLYKNTGTDVIPSGTPVAFGALIGVAYNDIAPDDEEPVGVEGVWELPCALSGAVARGTRLSFDAGAGKMTDTAPAFGAPGGVAARDAEAGAVSLHVKINV